MSDDPQPDIERALVLSYVPQDRRPAFAALWRLDATLADVVRGGGGAMVRQIKLVWWRDALAALDQRPAPAEPLLRSLSADVLPRGARGRELAELEDPWTVLLEESELGREDLEQFAARGRLLFDLAARLLGARADEALLRAGEGWALVDLARHSGRESEAGAALALARERLAEQRRWPGPLRPIGMLAALAARDARAGALPLERQGSPGRLLRMLRMRISGR